MYGLERLWNAFLSPLLRRPMRLQMAALCHRGEGLDKQFLLVTSRDTGRWVIPKGWPIRGLKSDETALQEAWEEAGVRGKTVAREPIGAFTYHKRQSAGWSFPVKTLVYEVAVEDMADNFPEAHERKRQWFDADQAAALVAEDGLKSILRGQQ